ncbi:MAG TPA: ATP-dependent DNA helicase RecG [Candidatus Limnocylindrales bacterium]|nr:ATP-dependent DNA helicase RecG [Candidatus Limnocylindrales bacterium]
MLRRLGPRLGILTLRDLLFHLPRRYDDLREMRLLGDLVWVADGTPVSARARVTDVRVEPGFRRRVQRTVARLEDESGSIDATWFGRRYIERRLHPGDRVVVSGRLKHFGRRLTLDNPDFQPDADDASLLHVGRIVPVYRLTAGLTAARLRTAIRAALDRAGDEYPEYLPDRIRVAEDLAPIGATLEHAHFPPDFPERDAALRRLAFDELLALQVGMVARRRERDRRTASPIEVTPELDTRLRGSVEASISRSLRRPVVLTADQAAAIVAVGADLARRQPMVRLLQGDVGSGKTAVAAWALGGAAASGLQGALLAPTDLLARQHAATVGALLEDAGIGVTLLTGSLSGAGTRKALDQIASGQAGVVVGTHALMSERVEFARLGLVVIDEQHRFGVEQRAQLEAKAADSPHVLLMTATPIPRTLGQVLYADLDVSNLRTPPEGRLRVGTGIRNPEQASKVWELVESEARAGRASFVVVPAIDESEDDGSVAATTEAERLRHLLPDLRVGLVHGRMKAAERDAEVGRLRDGELDVLVGTTVLEVGVDVPRATVMVVEAAERFGLAQLHQLRGRVGRGTEQSYAALLSTAAPSNEAWRRLTDGDVPPETPEQARLVALARTTDGFELAEQDWEIRREGDVLGFDQSGLPSLRVASLAREGDRELAVRARRHAEALLDEAGRLGPDEAALDRELRTGWLRGLWAGEVAAGV